MTKGAELMSEEKIYSTREEMIEEIQSMAAEYEINTPDGFPDKMTDKEMQDWIWNWSEYTGPYPDDID